jgi:hypothetical protein
MDFHIQNDLSAIVVQNVHQIIMCIPFVEEVLSYKDV